MHQGKFEPAFEQGQKDAALRGAGVLAVTASGLRLSGKRLNEGLVMGLSVAIAIGLGLVVIVGFVIVDDMTAGHVSTRLGAALGIFTLFVGYAGGRMVVEKIFPGAPFDHVLPLSQITGASLTGDRIGIVSRDPAISGAIAFRTPTAAALATELDQARSQMPRA